MNHVLKASIRNDPAALEAVGRHHEQLATRLTLLAKQIASCPTRQGAMEARDDLVWWAERELLPHAVVEERAIHRLARATPQGRRLLQAMLVEHGLMADLVSRLRVAGNQAVAAAQASALMATFRSHVAREIYEVLQLLTHCTSIPHPDTARPVFDAACVPQAIRHAAILNALERGPVAWNLRLPRS